MELDLLKLNESRQLYLYTPQSWQQPNGLEQQFETKHHPTARWLKPAEPQTFVTETFEVL
jgi:allophanate hydrolase subunit 2